MNHKTPRVEALLASVEGNEHFDRHYLGYFACFNQQLYYEAHDVLEAKWLPVRGTSVARFYQGLIQMAGAFVHFQKNRLGPGARLLNLALANYTLYPDDHEGISLADLRKFCTEKRDIVLHSSETINPWSPAQAPQLDLPQPPREGLGRKSLPLEVASGAKVRFNS